jgi:hypothetical protein
MLRFLAGEPGTYRDENGFIFAQIQKNNPVVQAKLNEIFKDFNLNPSLWLRIKTYCKKIFIL